MPPQAFHSSGNGQRALPSPWKLIQQADGTIQPALLGMVPVARILRIPSTNFVVVASIILAASLMAATIYLIVDMALSP